MPPDAKRRNGGAEGARPTTARHDGAVSALPCRRVGRSASRFGSTPAVVLRASHPVLRLFDTDGQPLHLGRGARLASAAQRLALYARDRGCNRPGCDMPPQWTQLHHLDEYQYGGLTDVEEMCLVCPFDHPLIADHGFTVGMGAHGRVGWIAPKHLDPSQTPRINTFYHPPDLSDRTRP